MRDGFGSISLGLILGLASLIAGVHPAQASLLDEDTFIPLGSISGLAALSSFQYANEKLPGPRLDLDLRFKPQGGLSEVRFVSFVETGDGGDWNLDLDPVVYRHELELNGESHIWVGRTHPLAEGAVSHEVFTTYPLATSAIGDNWVQNQTSALDPRSSGWIGTGIHYELPGTGFGFTAAYSPIFLPDFGPALHYSETDPAHGSRFARLPPSYVRVGEAVVPLRYQIDVGDLSKVLLQNQFFLSAERVTSGSRLALLAWSAPSGKPQVDTDAALRVTENNLNVLVTAKPDFRRQNFVGSRLLLTAIPGQPNLQAVYEAGQRQLTVSASASFALLGRSSIQGGILHTFELAEQANPNPSVPETPRYDDRLVWTELQAELGARTLASFRLEENLAPGREGSCFRPQLSYQARSHLNLFASATILTGKDLSYFGTWRSLDSVSVGARYLW